VWIFVGVFVGKMMLEKKQLYIYLISSWNLGWLYWLDKVRLVALSGFVFVAPILRQHFIQQGLQKDVTCPSWPI
jgi:hypothetical protein